jgi:hypothetical protein
MPLPASNMKLMAYKILNGEQILVPKLDQGFTHCFQLTFLSEAFGDLLHPHLNKVLVVDYWANEK